MKYIVYVLVVGLSVAYCTPKNQTAEKDIVFASSGRVASLLQHQSQKMENPQQMIKDIAVATHKSSALVKEMKVWEKSKFTPEFLFEHLMNVHICMYDVKQFTGCFYATRAMVSHEANRLKYQGKKVVFDFAGLEKNVLRGKEIETLKFTTHSQGPHGQIQTVLVDSAFAVYEPSEIKPSSDVEYRKKLASELEKEYVRIKDYYNTHLAKHSSDLQKVTNQQLPYTIRIMNLETKRDKMEKAGKLSARSAKRVESRIQSYMKNKSQFNKPIEDIVAKGLNPFGKVFSNIWDQTFTKIIKEEKNFFAGQFYNVYLRYSSDGHSGVLIAPWAEQELNVSSNNRFYGIGAEVYKDPASGNIFLKPFKNSPAILSGVNANDRVIKVIDVKSGESIETNKETTLDEVVSRIKGPENTMVKIALEPWDKKGTQKLVTITRKLWNVDILNGSFEKWGDKVYRSIKILSFQNGGQFAPVLCTELSEQIEEYDHNVDGYVIDLQNNPGGNLSEVLCMLDIFLAEDIPLLGTSKTLPSDEDYAYTVEPPETDKDLVVLINGRSASASEIFAGVIQEYGRGLVISEDDSSWGKGSVQTVGIMEHPVFKGLRVFAGFEILTFKQTTNRYYFPSKQSPDVIGVSPDIQVVSEDKNKDEFQYKATQNLPFANKAISQRAKQRRPEYVAAVKTCVEERGMSRQVYKSLDTPFRKSLAYLYGMDALHCMNAPDKATQLTWNAADNQ